MDKGGGAGGIKSPKEKEFTSSYFEHAPVLINNTVIEDCFCFHCLSYAMKIRKEEKKDRKKEGRKE